VVLKDAQSTLTVSNYNFGRNFNEALVHQVIYCLMQLVLVKGTRAQKTRAEVTVSGENRGARRRRLCAFWFYQSPIWRSGGVTCCSSRRTTVKKVNKKMYRGALKSILSELVRQGSSDRCREVLCRSAEN